VGGKAHAAFLRRRPGDLVVGEDRVARSHMGNQRTAPGDACRPQVHSAPERSSVGGPRAVLADPIQPMSRPLKKRTELSSNDLKEAAVSGVRWTMVARVASELISLVSAVVLARLVAPSEFGEAV